MSVKVSIAPPPPKTIHHRKLQSFSKVCTGFSTADFLDWRKFSRQILTSTSLAVA
jgi:hypothetical protein